VRKKCERCGQPATHEYEYYSCNPEEIGTPAETTGRFASSRALIISPALSRQRRPLCSRRAKKKRWKKPMEHAGGRPPHAHRHFSARVSTLNKAG
jgi:hypothetical protein